MGLLTKHPAGLAGPHPLPSGAFTVDARGNLVSSTVPQRVPDSFLVQIGRQVLTVFKGAAAARLGVAQLKVEYQACKISARALRGGAIIFLSPKPTARPLPPL